MSAANPGNTGTITLRTSIHLEKTTSDGYVLVGSIRNSGNQKAHRIVIEAGDRLQNQVERNLRKHIAVEIPPKAGSDFKLELPARLFPKDETGIHFLPLTLFYRDQENYLFSSPLLLQTLWRKSSVGTLELIRSGSAQAEAGRVVLDLFDRSEVDVEISNPGTEVLNLRLDSWTTREIEVRSKAGSFFRLGPLQSMKVPIEVTNLSGAAGSRYVNYLIFSAAKGGERQAEVHELVAHIQGTPTTAIQAWAILLLGLAFIWRGARKTDPK